MLQMSNYIFSRFNFVCHLLSLLSSTYGVKLCSLDVFIINIYRKFFTFPSFNSTFNNFPTNDIHAIKFIFSSCYVLEKFVLIIS